MLKEQWPLRDILARVETMALMYLRMPRCLPLQSCPCPLIILHHFPSLFLNFMIITFSPAHILFNLLFVARVNTAISVVLSNSLPLHICPILHGKFKIRLWCIGWFIQWTPLLKCISSIPQPRQFRMLLPWRIPISLILPRCLISATVLVIPAKTLLLLPSILIHWRSFGKSLIFLIILSGTTLMMLRFTIVCSSKNECMISRLSV